MNCTRTVKFKAGFKSVKRAKRLETMAASKNMGQGSSWVLMSNADYRIETCRQLSITVTKILIVNDTHPTLI